jgi:hypothetical protein
MHLDAAAFVLAVAGVGVAVAVAILVGRLTAGLFFHATRSIEDGAEPRDITP